MWNLFDYVGGRILKNDAPFEYWNEAKNCRIFQGCVKLTLAPYKSWAISGNSCVGVNSKDPPRKLLHPTFPPTKLCNYQECSAL